MGPLPGPVPSLNVEGGDDVVLITQETMIHVGAVDVVAGDLATLADRVAVCPLGCARARARDIEGGDVAIRVAQETVTTRSRRCNVRGVASVSLIMSGLKGNVPAAPGTSKTVIAPLVANVAVRAAAELMKNPVVGQGSWNRPAFPAGAVPAPGASKIVKWPFADRTNRAARRSRRGRIRRSSRTGRCYRRRCPERDPCQLPARQR